MTKAVKEFLLDQGTGEVNVEYSDNTTTSFNLANAITATQSGPGVVKVGRGVVSAAGPVLSGPVDPRALYAAPRHTIGRAVCLFDTPHKLVSQCTGAQMAAPSDYPGYRPAASPNATMLTTSGTANTYSVHEIPAGAAETINASAGSLILWLYIPDRAALCAGGISVVVEMWAGTGTSPDATCWISVSATGVPGPWSSGLHRVVIDKSQIVPSGASPAAWADITRCRIQIKKASTPTLNAAAQYMLVALTFGQRCARPKVTFTFDKSYVSQLYGMDLLAEAGIPFATSLIASQVGNVVAADTVMSAEQLMRLAEKTQGLLIPHTTNTVQGSGSDAAAFAALMDNIADIDALGLPNFDRRFVKYASGSYSYSTLDDGIAALLRDSGWCQAALISSGGGQVGPWWRDRFYARRQLFQGPAASAAAEAAAIQADLAAGRSRIVSAHSFKVDATEASEIEPAKYRALVESLIGFEQQGLCDIVGLPEYVAALE